MKLPFFAVVVMLCLTLPVNAAKLEGKPAPDFIGKTISGEEIKLSDYKGKVVLLDFWASWCGPCREEMPFLIDFYRHNKNRDFEIIAINIDDKAKNMEKFLSNIFGRPEFPILFDQHKNIPPLYDIETMPTTIFIDKNGTVRYWHNGFKKSYEVQFQDELNALLKEK